MTRNKFRIVLYAVLSLFLMAVIFCLSSQSAPESRNLSDSLLFRFLSFLGIEDASLMERLGKPIRKLAHFAEYVALGLSLALFFTELAGNIPAGLKPGALRGFGVCALYAVSDELHQHFVPGRSMQLSDVLLDCAGASVAVLFLVILKKYTYSHREERKTFE